MKIALPLETSPEIAALAPRFAVLPVGAMEQHGPHLPLTTDTIIASAIAARLSKNLSALQLPALPISCSHEHAAFPGTISISATTISCTIKDIMKSIAQHGIKFTIIINAHGGNYVIGNIIQEMNVDDARIFLCPTRQQWEMAAKYAGISSTVSADMHGGEIETSLMMHICPESVRDKALFKDVDAPHRPFLNTFGMHYYTETGIIGFPTKASAQKGDRLLSYITDRIASDISDVVGRK